jgi:hypothetical protein
MKKPRFGGAFFRLVSSYRGRTDTAAAQSLPPASQMVRATRRAVIAEQAAPSGTDRSSC